MALSFILYSVSSLVTCLLSVLLSVLPNQGDDSYQQECQPGISNAFGDVDALWVEAHFDGVFAGRHVHCTQNVVCTGNVSRLPPLPCRRPALWGTAVIRLRCVSEKRTIGIIFQMSIGF